MKLNRYYSTSAVLYKLIGVSFLAILCFPLLATAVNVDSLKQTLKKSDNHQDNCHLLFKIYKHYETIKQVDSLNLYAKRCLKECDLSETEVSPIINEIINEQYKQGFASNVNPIADSILLVIEDPDIKLQLLVKLAEASFYNEEKETYDNYWSQAEKAITYAKDDYSRHIYYDFLGYKNSAGNNIFAAFLSLKLALNFVDNNGDDFLRTSHELAYIYLLNGEIEKAKDILIDLLKRAKEDNHKKMETYISWALMDCYIESDDYHAAIDLALESIERFSKYNLNVPEGYSYSIIGQAYLALYNMDSVNRGTNKSTNNILMDGVNISISYLDSTKHYLDQGIAFSIKHNHSKELADNYTILSDYYKTIGNYEQAKLYLVKAQKEVSYFDNSVIDKNLSELWAADNNYNKAYSYLNKYTENKLQKEKEGKKDLALATKIIEDSYKYKEESQANILKAKQKEKRLQNIIAFTIAGLFLFASLLMYVQRNRKILKVLNKRIDDRNKELDLRNRELDQRNMELDQSNKALDLSNRYLDHSNRALDLSNKDLDQRNKELDISINKQRETIKYLDNFASVAAHDLKAPIRTASSFAGLLTRTSADKLNDKEKGYLEYIGTSVAQLSGMIDDLLSLSRLDSDLPVEKEVNLKEVVIGIESLLSNLLSKTKSKIIVESSLPKVRGHSTLISQLFQNIIKNAIVHNKTGNNTIIKISAELEKDKKWKIRVSDNSGGIPEHMIPTMFDLFSSSDKNSGNGIGLATCKKIVNHYGGDIWVDVEPGVGTTFNFNLFS